MNIRRKIQLGAVAVTINAMAALIGMSPQPAAAAACSQPTWSACGICPMDVNAYCQALAQPGCTASGTCVGFVPFCQGPMVLCQFN